MAVGLPHLAVVTKADVGPAAARALADLKSALSLGAERMDWEVESLAVSARDRSGLDELMAALERHRAHLAEGGRLAAQRYAQAEAWLEDAVRERFGREGLKRAGGLSLPPGESPFRRLVEIARQLRAADRR